MAESQNRYIRQITLPQIGIEGQGKISASKALIVGAGGLGSTAALYLAGAGIGTIGIVDDDVVALVNLHRQILHKTKDIGMKKTDSAAMAIRGLNDDVAVEKYNERFTDSNAVKVIDGYNIVIDCSDNFETRYVINRACVGLGLPFVHGSILRMIGQVSVFDTTRGGPCYSCVYPEPPPEDVAPKGSVAGILGPVPGIIGTIQALEVIKLLVGFGEPCIGKLLIFNGLTCKMRTLEVKKDLKCKVCVI